MYNQRKPHSIHHQRDGITLLFVISMVVLFLLMGTTFVVVSNDYFKAARRRSRLSTNVVNNEALLDRAFYQLMREVPLADSSSPMRGHSILADQYGYGIKSQVAAFQCWSEDLLSILRSVLMELIPQYSVGSEYPVRQYWFGLTLSILMVG